MMESRWRIDKPRRECWVLYPIPTIFIWGVDFNVPNVTPNWGIGIWWLAWSIEWWRHPVPKS